MGPLNVWDLTMVMFLALAIAYDMEILHHGLIRRFDDDKARVSSTVESFFSTVVFPHQVAGWVRQGHNPVAAAHRSVPPSSWREAPGSDGPQAAAGSLNIACNTIWSL